MRTIQQTNVWQFIQSCLAQQTPVALLYVVESKGSSPGREGFYMAAAQDTLIGTIGGGVMEYKLVELSRSMIKKGDNSIRLITQYHDKERLTDQSGMICSGMQRVAIIPLGQKHRTLVGDYLNVLAGKRWGQIVITPDDISLESKNSQQEGFCYEHPSAWKYYEQPGPQLRLHIVGAGHVSLALSDLMSRLGFYIIVYDDRSEVNTLTNNRFAHEVHIIQYDSIGSIIQIQGMDYIAVMTIGYRSDKIVLRQLIDKPFFYIGMLGSAQKVRTVFDELQQEGIPEEQLHRVCAPIGLQIHSQTSDEIAVSIAAEIIQRKNAMAKKLL